MSGTERRCLPSILRRYWLAMALLTGCSIVFTTARAWVFHLRFPYEVGILYGESIWGDLLVFTPGLQHFGTPQFWSSFDYPFTYPAPLAIPMAMLFRSGHPVKVYLGLELAAIAGAAWWLVRQLRERGVAEPTAWAFTLTNLAMTWPLLFLLDTANAEGFVVMMLACGVYAVLRQRWWLGAALIGIAGSMKVFPLVLLGLLLAQRRYKEFAGGLAVAGIVTVASLAYLGPSVVEAQRHIDVGMALIQHTYLFTLKPDAAALDHSLWVAVRYAAVYGDRLLHPVAAADRVARTNAVLEISLRVYLVLSALCGVALYFLHIRKLPVLNMLLALTVCAVLLPPLSLEYTLVHLLLPFALLCAYAVAMSRSGVAIRGLGVCFACFAVIFNIETFLTTRLTYAAEARTLALIVLLLVVLRHRFPWSVLDPAPGKAAA